MCGCVDKSPPALSSPYCYFDFGMALKRMKPWGTEVHCVVNPIERRSVVVPFFLKLRLSRILSFSFWVPLDFTSTVGYFLPLSAVVKLKRMMEPLGCLKTVKAPWDG